MAPLSYRECLSHKNIHDQITLVKEKSTALSIVDSLLLTGSLPKPYLESDIKIKTKLLARYYQTILLKDCISTGNIRDVRLLKELSHYMLTNVGTRYSYSNLTKYIDSNEHTVKDYIAILKSGFLIDEIPSFSFSLKKQARGNKKSYCVDNGLINAVAFNFFPNDGQLFENLIYTELKKINASEVYLFNDSKECDFIVNTPKGFVSIQACYMLTPDNRNREIDGLRLGMANSKSKSGLIITYNQEEKLDNNILITPFWKLFYLLHSIDDLADLK